MEILNLNNKYKPKSINECLIDDNIKKTINSYIKNNTINNMLIVSSLNYCKTTLIKCIIRDYYYNNDNFKKYNISNFNEYYKIYDTIIDIKDIYENINLFCRKMINNYKSEIKRIIFFDNFTIFSNDIQNKIYNCMINNKNVVFIFLTSKLIDVIDNIQNNIFIMNISKINEEEYKNYIISILNKENIKISKDALMNLYILSNGDIRFTLNQLNALILLTKKHSKDIIDIDTIKLIYKVPDTIIINNLIKLCKEKNIKQLIKISNELYKDNFTCNDILNAMFYKLSCLEIENDDDIDLMNKIGKHILYYSSTINSILQLEKCFIQICSEKEFDD